MYRLAARQLLRSLSLTYHPHRSLLLPCSRNFNTTRHRPNAGQPTKLHNILEGGPAPPVQVRKITQGGIELEDGLILSSSCIFLDGQVFLWDVPVPRTDMGTGSSTSSGVERRWEGWTKEHFEVFEVVVPKPEILILGTGKTVSLPPPPIKSYLNSLGIQLDIMDTWNACTTYNLLAEEGRHVAAALLPTMPRTWKKRS